MLEELIEEIRAAEEKAEAIVQSAGEEAKEIARNAEKRRAGIVSAGKKAAAELLASLEKETDLASLREEERIINNGREQATALKAEAENRVGAAADEIAKQLFVSYGITSL